MKASSRLWHSSAAVTASVAWLADKTGAPNIATMASPTNLSTNPPASSIASPIDVRYAFMSDTMSCGDTPSESVENPTTSEKNNVISRVSPPSVGSAPEDVSRSMTLGER